MHVLTHTNSYAYTHAHTYTHMFMYTYTHKHAHTCLCTHTHTHTYMHVQCVEVEPNRGELWCRVAKNPKNAHDKMEVLLKKVGWGMVCVRGCGWVDGWDV